MPNHLLIKKNYWYEVRKINFSFENRNAGVATFPKSQYEIAMIIKSLIGMIFFIMAYSM